MTLFVPRLLFLTMFSDSYYWCMYLLLVDMKHCT